MDGHPAPFAFAPTKAERRSTGTGRTPVLGRNSLDLMDGRAVEGAAGRVRFAERRASALVPMGERRHTAELVAGLSRAVE